MNTPLRRCRYGTRSQGTSADIRLSRIIRISAKNCSAGRQDEKWLRGLMGPRGDKTATDRLKDLNRGMGVVIKAEND